MNGKPAFCTELLTDLSKIGPKPYHRSTALQNRARIAEEQKKQAESRALERFQTREWRAGDVYAPHDLSPAQMRKWKVRHSPPTDAFDAIDKNPLDLYKVYFSSRQICFVIWNLGNGMAG